MGDDIFIYKIFIYCLIYGFDDQFFFLYINFIRGGRVIVKVFEFQYYGKLNVVLKKIEIFKIFEF